jgi:tight adherence protein B
MFRAAYSLISKCLGVGLFLFSSTLWAQTPAPAQPEGEKEVYFFYNVLGMKGVLILIGVMFFAFTYWKSQELFAWIDRQTYGARDYILEKFKLMHIEIEPQKVTYILLFFYFGFGMLVVCLFALMGKIGTGIFFGGIVSLIGWKLPKIIVDKMLAKRVSKYQGQLVDGLNLLANGIRAGLSMPQAIGMVVDEMYPPLSQEFNLILQETRIGAPLEEALENLNKRVKTEDNEMFVTSVNVLREQGGNLSETFETIVSVIRERVRVQQKIETYVAQGMIQGLVIFSMPYALMLMNISNDPNYLSQMFTTPVGIIMLILIVGLSTAGYSVIRKIVSIKV